MSRSSERLTRRAPVLLVLSCLLTACSDRPAVARRGADAAAPPPPLPSPAPLAGRPLGEVPWVALSGTRARDAVLVGTPRGVERVRWPSRDAAWRAPLEAAPLFVAESGDGARDAALVRREGGYALVVFDARSGAALERVEVELPAGRDDDRDSVPSPAPTALDPDPGGSGFLVTNAFGVWRIAPGHRGALPPGTAGWRRDGADLISVAGARVGLGCPAQRFAVGADRVASLCVAKDGRATLRLQAIGAGAPAGEWPLPGLAEMAILGADEVLLLAEDGSRRGHLKDGALSWTLQGGGLGGFEVSPSGRTVLGVGASVVQAVDLESGRVRCTLGDVSAWGAGLESDDVAWILGFDPVVFNKLQIRRADLAACRLDPPRPLELGKTTNLAALWLPGPRAFALNALYGADYGPVLVGVDGAVTPLGGRRTPRIVASDDGTRLALVESESAELLRGTTPQRTLAPAAHVALCGEHTLVYDWKQGWRLHDASGEAVAGRAPFARHPQPDVFACRGTTLLVGRIDAWYAIDVASGAVGAAWEAGGRVGGAALLPDGRRAVFGGGPTGWRVAPIR